MKVHKYLVNVTVKDFKDGDKLKKNMEDFLEKSDKIFIKDDNIELWIIKEDPIEDLTMLYDDVYMILTETIEGEFTGSLYIVAEVFSTEF